MKTSITVVDDTNLVSNIQINKGITLDNTATITFAKSKTYNLLDMEKSLKLYNYVKIELDLQTYDPQGGNKFWFSGFIQSINKSANFGMSPNATVSITVTDYANLMKTTFYTKNLTFLEILNQAVPEFRLVNLSKELGADSEKLLTDFYSPTQLGFIFFLFLYFKFMYRILYETDGSTKKTAAPDSREIFKKFKVYMPFGFEIAGNKSMLNGQEQTLTLYKQLQGVALDLFKYIYPEPIFEFNTFETYDTVILMIRLTPFMKFDRPYNSPTEISVGEQDVGMLDTWATTSASSRGASFYADSYNVIERYDFGFNRIKSCREAQGVSPATLLREHLEETKAKKPKRIITTIQKAIGKSKNINVDDLIANNDEADEITDLFYNEQPIDARFLESMAMTRSASSVVNVIWTVPTTDTAILKMSGREMVYAFLEEKLTKLGGEDKFGSYLLQQFNEGFNPNPVFLMDYKSKLSAGENFVSGDMNYFGFREFEIKWNYLSLLYNSMSYILNNIDKKVLAEARKLSANTTQQRILDNAMRRLADPTTRSTEVKANGKVVDLRRKWAENTEITTTGSVRTYQQTSRTSKKPSNDKQKQINDAVNQQLFKDALERYSEEAGLGKLNKTNIQNAKTVVALLDYARKADDQLMTGFVSKLNGVVAEAYRENEHLYDCTISKPIDLSVLPGMIVKSSSESFKASSPFFKGYVTAISHAINFGTATMKTSINISRTASDDSGIVGAPVGPD
jgi:hypothetical protein